MSLRQAFSRWWRSSSDGEREENPEIAEALGERKAIKRLQKEKKKQQEKEKRQESSSRRQPAPTSNRDRAQHPGTAKSPAAKPTPNAEQPPRAPRGGASGERKGTSSGPSNLVRTATPSSSEKVWRDPSVPTPAFNPRYVPVELPKACDARDATVSAHCEPRLGVSKPTQPESKVRTTLGKLGIRVSRQSLRVQVGLDFGTSTTKVMYSVRNRGEKQHLPLDLKHDIPGLPSYLLPSVATFDRAGRLLLGHRASNALAGIEWSSGLSNFKVLLAGRHEARYLDKWVDARFREHVKKAIGDDANCSPDALTAAYLAYVMLRTRRILELELGGDQALDIAFNTCVPIDQRENNLVLKAYQRVCGVAEKLVDLASPGTDLKSGWLDTAMKSLAEGEIARAERLFVVPESVAAVSAYTTSLARSDGLHALVDIGAGTTDVSIFRLYQSQSQGLTSQWLSARSIPIGTAHIEQRVADALTEQMGGETVDREHVLAAMMGRSGTLSAGEKAIRDGMQDIWHKSTKGWADAYGKLKKESFWRGPTVKVFLAGGGGLIPVARKFFAESWQRGWGPYPCEVLPNPDGWSKPGQGASFARLCVAYGLCIPVPELGNFTMPSETDDLTPTPAVRKEWEQDNDQLTPRPGWS